MHVDMQRDFGKDRKAALAAASKVKMLVLDVDGVLTDGGLYYAPDGSIMKRFNVQDGLGIKLAQKVGLDVGVITGLKSEVVERRVRELGIEYYYPGFIDKRESMEEIRTKAGLEWDEMAFLGDDWVDWGPLSKAGLPLAVSNAQQEILDMAVWVTMRHGGHGAVREAINFILEARGLKTKAWEDWTA